jgi:hypothetical protein
MIEPMASKGEKPKIPRQHTLQLTNEAGEQRAVAVNMQIRDGLPK